MSAPRKFQSTSPQLNALTSQRSQHWFKGAHNQPFPEVYPSPGEKSCVQVSAVLSVWLKTYIPPNERRPYVQQGQRNCPDLTPHLCKDFLELNVVPLGHTYIAYIAKNTDCRHTSEHLHKLSKDVEKMTSHEQGTSIKTKMYDHFRTLVGHGCVVLFAQMRESTNQGLFRAQEFKKGRSFISNRLSLRLESSGYSSTINMLYIRPI